MPRNRFQPPDRLVGATAFAREDDMRGALNLIRLIKANRWVWSPLRDACDLDHRHGRRRERGNWDLIAVAFVVSDYVDIQPWHDESSEELWTACGFADKPSYRTTWRRLRELAGVSDLFLDAAGALIRRARTQDERVMAHVHFDSTEDETHAALVHDCDPATCPKRDRKRRGKRPARQDTKLFRAERHELAAKAPEQLEADAARVAEDTELVARGSRTLKRVKVGGCWYRTLDPDAGVRAYMGPRGAKRFWHGYYSGKAICHFTGGVIPHIDSASRQEYDIFGDHYERVRTLTGAAPETVIGDKGLSVESVFRKCTVNGTAPVMPWRPGGGDLKRHDKDTHDRHGVPRCRHCGGPTDFVRFAPGDQNRAENDRNARLWVQCMTGATPECVKPQTIACSRDYRLLVPLWRTDPLYHELKASHSSYEAQHDWWRDRYKVAADDLGLRPKVRDINFHRLRANAACLVDWLRICYLQGWLGNPDRKARKAEKEEKLTRSFKERGAKAAAHLTSARHLSGLMGAYGEAAVKTGLGELLPPSKRDVQRSSTNSRHRRRRARAASGPPSPPG